MDKPQITNGTLPLAMLPGVNVGDLITVQVTGIQDTDATVKLVPNPAQQLSPAQAQIMPLNDLKSFLTNQAATRSYENPSATINPNATIDQ